MRLPAPVLDRGTLLFAHLKIRFLVCRINFALRGDRICRMENAALIVNARSRTGERAFEEALERLVSLGVEVGGRFPVHDPARLAETARAAVLAGHDPIIIGGGDGSVSSLNGGTGGLVISLLLLCSRANVRA